MRELVRDRDRLEHIVEAIDRILDNTDFKSRDGLEADNLRYYGIPTRWLFLSPQPTKALSRPPSG